MAKKLSARWLKFGEADLWECYMRYELFFRLRRMFSWAFLWYIVCDNVCLWHQTFAWLLCLHLSWRMCEIPYTYLRKKHNKLSLIRCKLARNTSLISNIHRRTFTERQECAKSKLIWPNFVNFIAFLLFAYSSRHCGTFSYESLLKLWNDLSCSVSASESLLVRLAGCRSSPIPGCVRSRVYWSLEMYFIRLMAFPEQQWGGIIVYVYVTLHIYDLLRPTVPVYHNIFFVIMLDATAAALLIIACIELYLL